MRLISRPLRAPLHTPHTMSRTPHPSTRHEYSYLSSIVTSIEKRLHECIQMQADIYFEVFVNRAASQSLQSSQTPPSPKNKRKRDIYENTAIHDNRIASLEHQLAKNIKTVKETIDAHRMQFAGHLKTWDEYKQSLKEQFLSQEAFGAFQGSISTQIQQFAAQYKSVNELLTKYHNEGLENYKKAMEGNEALGKDLGAKMEVHSRGLQEQSKQMKKAQEMLERFEKLHETHQTQFDVLTSRLDAFAEQMKQQEERLAQEHKEGSNLPASTPAPTTSDNTQHLSDAHKQLQEEFGQFREKFSTDLSNVTDSFTQTLDKTLESRFASLQEQWKSDLESSVGAYKVQLSEITSQFDTKLEEQNTKITTSLTSSLDELRESSSKEHQQFTTQFTTKFDEHVAATDKRLTSAEDRMRDIEEVQKNAQQNGSGNDTDALRDEINALRGASTKEHQEFASKFTTQFQDYDKRLTSAEDKMRDIEEHNTTADTKLEKRFKVLETKLADSESAAKSLEAKIQDNEVELANYKADSDEKINALDMTHSFKNLESKFTKLSTTFEKQLEKLKSTQSSMQSIIDDLQKENANLKAHIASLEKSVAEAQTSTSTPQKESQESARPSKKRKLSTPQDDKKQNGSAENGDRSPEKSTKKTKSTKKKTPTKSRGTRSTPASASEEVEDKTNARAPCIIFSGFKDDETSKYNTELKNHLQDVVVELGGRVADDSDFPHATTHVVSPPQLRTLKTLGAAVSGNYICAPEWLEECEKAGKFVSCDGNPHCQMNERKLLNKVLGYSEDFAKSKDRKSHSSQLISWGGGSVSEDLSKCDMILVGRNDNKEKMRTKYPQATMYKWEKLMDELLPSAKVEKKAKSEDTATRENKKSTTKSKRSSRKK